MTPLLYYGLLLLNFLSAATAKSLSCTDLTFKVHGNAQNRNITSSIPLGNVTELIQAFKDAPLIGVISTQEISGTYCLPTRKNANNNKLQVLFGSITGNRGDWNAQGGIGTEFTSYNPQYYSWTRYANARGYATLAIDRLGSGKSSHPDPVTVVQAPFEESLYSNLAKQLRKGTTGLINRKYHHLIYVGNSYGSQVGAGVAGKYPAAYDEYILTGFSKNVQQDFAGVLLTMPAPAAVVAPKRFSGLAPAYVTTSSKTGRINSFFGSKSQVSFSNKVASLFYHRKDVVSLGQFASIYAIRYAAPDFTGRVLVLTGEQDQAFCGPGSPVIGPAHCGSLLKNTGTLFPKADYNWKSVERTGHAIQDHYSAPLVFRYAHSFLAGESFTG